MIDTTEKMERYLFNFHAILLVTWRAHEVEPLYGLARLLDVDAISGIPSLSPDDVAMFLVEYCSAYLFADRMRPQSAQDVIAFARSRFADFHPYRAVFDVYHEDVANYLEELANLREIMDNDNNEQIPY